MIERTFCRLHRHYAAWFVKRGRDEGKLKMTPAKFISVGAISSDCSSFVTYK
jgi:hypothetical protein